MSAKRKHESKSSVSAKRRPAETFEQHQSTFTRRIQEAVRKFPGLLPATVPVADRLGCLRDIGMRHKLTVAQLALKPEYAAHWYRGLVTLCSYTGRWVRSYDVKVKLWDWMALELAILEKASIESVETAIRAMNHKSHYFPSVQLTPNSTGLPARIYNFVLVYAP